MTYLFKNIFIKSAVFSIIIIFIFGFLSGREAIAISITGSPAAANIDTTSADISWLTDVNGDSQVYFTENNSPVWSKSNLESFSFSFTSIDGLDRKNLWASGYEGAGSKIYHYNGASWVLQYSSAAIQLYSLDVLDATHVWAVGSGGNILFYNGTAWSVQTNLGGSIYKIRALSASQVWAAGRNAAGQGVIYFFDGSAWSLKATYANPFNSLWVGDASHVWATTQNGEIMFYNGLSLASQKTYTYALFDINGYDSTHIWTVGQGGRINFYDGFSWQLQHTATDTLFAISVAGHDSIWSVGGSLIYHTENGGGSWSSVSPPVSGGSMYGVFHFTAYQVWVGSFLGNIHFYGLNYGNLKFNNTQTVNHQINLSSLAPSTIYYYYVCSRNLSLEEVCSNDYEFTTLGVCPDGTYAGLCNGIKYCDPVLLTLVDNCTKCSFVCPASDIFCNTGNGSCQPGCDLTTPVGSCSGSQYCQSAGTFVNDCRQCGYTCAAPDIYCNLGNGQCQAGCDINTPVGGCVGTQYCQSAGSLVNNCDKCFFSCPASDPYCDDDSVSATYGQCQKKCTDGTPQNSCNGALQRCDAAFVLHTDCGTNIAQCDFACPSSAPFCDGTNCFARCPDGTETGQCNAADQYCDPVTFQLSNNCSINQTRCGYVCPAAAVSCNSGSGLCEPGCNSTTSVGACFGTQYCQSANNFVNNCLKCGYTCPVATPYCSAAGQCLPACSDGTNFGECNAASQYCCRLSGDSFCSPGQLSPTTGHNCQECSFDCSTTSTEPYCDATGTHACAEQCVDGTARGGCNLATKMYCNAALQLVNDCRQCGYTCPAATPQCEEDSGVCIADTEPPVISNIEIINITYNSAVLTFDTKDAAGNPELAQADVAVLLNADCTLPDPENLYKLIYAGDYLSSFNILMDELLPSTTYYLNIGVWDMAENFFATCPPASVISFTTSAEPDLEAPAVRILTPTGGENISGGYNITWEASDNIKVTKVELFLDDETFPLYTWENGPYVYLFDTLSRLAGPHTLHAVAYDGSDNSKVSDLVNFVIGNDVTPPVLSKINPEVSLDEVSGKRQAVITWETDEPATSRIDYVIEEGGIYDHFYGDDKECLFPKDCVKDDTLTTSHRLELTNLEPNSRYHYRITSCDVKYNCAH